MYATCIFCTRPLGSNQVVEHFPVGRRLAFDGEKGRLWVICRKCLRWNLTPIKERVAEIASSGHPSRFITDTANKGHRGLWFREGHIRSFPETTKLALEMALHEEQERRALEGELWILEQAWKEAEEIAAISDNLLLPAGTGAFFERHGREGDSRPGR